MACIGKITTSLSHELRNPLSAVKMNLQILKKNHQFTDNDQRRIDISVNEVMRLEGILREILDFAKPLHLTPGACDINQILVACLELLNVQFEQKRIAVFQAFAADIPPMQADGEKLSQAVINLLLNAFDASAPEGRIWVTSRYHPQGDPANVEVAIDDEGNGIAKKQLRDIFEPFFTTKANGTGLGLTNVKRIIEAHGGWVEVANRDPQGASFRLYLPINYKNLYKQESIFAYPSFL
jgi:signal transduction histidine kinase